MHPHLATGKNIPVAKCGFFCYFRTEKPFFYRISNFRMDSNAGLTIQMLSGSPLKKLTV